MTAPDPAVRSIRIATTLNERFRDLMNGRGSPGDGTAELELRIGEAQQIYPEIWNHLDDARKVIAERGGDTATYDQIKASQGPARLGVTRVEVEDHHSIGLGGYSHVQTKEAHFNLDGFRAAHKACAALMAAMPEVDWKAVERAENQEIAAAGSLGPIDSKKTVRWLVIAGALLGVTYLFWYLVIRIPPVSREEREAREQVLRTQRITESRTKLDADPCDKPALDQLSRDLDREIPGGQGDAANNQYREQCGRKIIGIQLELDKNPCDGAKLAELTAALRMTGPKSARQAAATYRDLCAASKSGPSEPQER
jgi:hypothetical protein